MNEHEVVDEDEAIEALERLGLAGSEAKMFIALQRLGVGGARDVAQLVDIPRPQVYRTAESLEEYGLINVQQSTPIQYRAIELEEAKAKLRKRFERTKETAFDYLKSVHREGHKNEERENTWKITRNETINSRITHFINNAETKLLFGIWSTPLLQEEIANALITAAERDVSVTVLSHDEALADQFPDLKGIKVVKTAIKDAEETSSRILVVDDDTVLLSVFDDDDPTITPGETAIWSSETGFAQVLVQLIEVYLRPMDGSS